MKTNQRKMFFACLAVFAVLVASLPLFAGNSTLNVKCIDASGSPIEKVKVEIFNLANQKKKDEKSNDRGIAEFKKLDDGVYRIWGRKDNFAPALHEFVVLKESSESVTLEFTPGADKKFYFEDRAITQEAFQLSKLGLEAYQGQKFGEAEKLFKQSIELDPSNPETLYYLSVALIQQSKFDESEKLLNKTAGIVDAFMNLPIEPGANPYERINAGVQKLLKDLPAIRAENALRERKYDEAVEGFEEALKEDPGNPEYYANIAIALTNSKKFDEAITYIEKALEIKPEEKSYTELKAKIIARQENAKIEQAQAIMNEGNKLLEGDDAAAAIKKFEEAITMVPEDTQAPLWRQIARAHAELDQSDAAVEAFKKSVELAPADSVAGYRNSYAQYHLDKEEYDQAIDILADPKTAGSQSVEEFLMSLANSSKDNNPVLAEAVLERVIKNNPENADAHFELGRMYYADGKEQDTRAREVLQRFVEISKDEQKISSANDLLTIIDRRNKEAEEE